MNIAPFISLTTSEVPCKCGFTFIYGVLLTKTTYGARASFLEKFENTILKFQKNLKLNIQVDNIVIYNRANFQVKIPYSLSCAKMTNSEIYNNEQCRFLKSHNLSKFVIFVQPRILGISSSNFARC
jgi:hypothetical protein